MDIFLYFFLGCGYLCLFVWGVFLARENGLLNLTNVLLLVIAGLIYDNLIIALGKFIGEGNILEKLSYVRFWLHALFTPTLIIFAWSICKGTGFRWANKAFSMVLFAVMTIGLILYELLFSVKGLKLEAKWKNDVLTYESAAHFDSLIMVVIVTVVMLIVGLFLIKRFRFPWLFIGSIVMILGGILLVWIKEFPIMNVLEFIFIVSLLMTKRFQVHYEKFH